MENMAAEELEGFIARIDKFEEYNASLQVDLIFYYLQTIAKVDIISTKSIKSCFELINHPTLSSLAWYLSINSRKKTKGKSQKFIKSGEGYKISRSYEAELSLLIGVHVKKHVSNNLFPFEIVKETRGYIIKVAEQAIIAYDHGIYDACFVMTRKLLEILIIELFERTKIESVIKNANGDFYFLSELIDKLLNETTWNLTRNTKQSLPAIKKIGDLSAHNRRFIAKQVDVDKIKNELRVVVEELVLLIDYPSWK